MEAKTLSPELLRKMSAYWRAANYLSVGQKVNALIFKNGLVFKPETIRLNEGPHMIWLYTYITTHL